MKRTSFLGVSSKRSCRLHRSMAVRSYPSSKVRDSDQECQTVMVQEQLRGATPRLGSGVGAETSYPMPKVRCCEQEEHPTSKVMNSGCTLLEQL